MHCWALTLLLTSAYQHLHLTLATNPFKGVTHSSVTLSFTSAYYKRWSHSCFLPLITSLPGQPRLPSKDNIAIHVACCYCGKRQRRMALSKCCLTKLRAMSFVAALLMFPLVASSARSDFYDFGTTHGDSTLVKGEDASVMVTLEKTFRVYEKNYNQLSVS